MAGKTDFFLADKDVSLIDAYADAGSRIEFSGPMRCVTVHNQHATIPLYINWGSGPGDQAVVPGGKMVSFDRIQQHVMILRRSTAGGVATVKADIMASSVGGVRAIG